MSDSGTPKRPNLRVGRLRTRPPPRDARAESAHPLRGDAVARRPASRPGLSLWPARLAGLETELARLKEERGLEADTVAEMLVRVAESERTVEAATRRAATAETTAQEIAAVLERTREELADARRGAFGLESMLAQARGEHVQALEAERSASARARQAAAVAEEALGAARQVIAQAATLVDDLERREETATALRVRALQQARAL
ncbi:MAG: hypothetical protein M3O36_13750, partial [Myxococcota bacterium]|nr:hypothetical protein [Myxococcota bacterium]